MAKNKVEHTIHKVFTIDKCICNHLTTQYFHKESNRYYADKADISETIIRKIKSDIGYRIPISTLKKIVDSLDFSLSSLISEVEQTYAKELKTEYLYYKEVKNKGFIKLTPSQVEKLRTMK